MRIALVPVDPVSSGKGDKEKTGGVPSETPPVATSTTEPEYVVSDALRDKVKRLCPDIPGNTGRAARTLKALEAGKVVHIGAHKLRATRVGKRA